MGGPDGDEVFACGWSCLVELHFIQRIITCLADGKLTSGMHMLAKLYIILSWYANMYCIAPSFKVE